MCRTAPTTTRRASGELPSPSARSTRSTHASRLSAPAGTTDVEESGSDRSRDQHFGLRSLFSVSISV